MKASEDMPGLESESGKKAKVVLLSERDPAILRPVLGLLQGDGHLVLEASDFSETLDQIYDHGADIDLAVMDVDLVLEDEVNLMERLHQIKPDLPMLVISHFGRTLPRMEANDMRRIRILRKPFEPVMVRTRVRELFGVRESTAPGDKASDRRAFRRAPIHQRNAVKLPGGDLFPVVDVSSGGIAVLTDREFSSGHTIDFSFKMISGFATVVRSSHYHGVGPFRSNNYLVQCRFGETMHPVDVEVLLEMLQ